MTARDKFPVFIRLAVLDYETGEISMKEFYPVLCTADRAASDHLILRSQIIPRDEVIPSLTDQDPLYCAKAFYKSIYGIPINQLEDAGVFKYNSDKQRSSRLKTVLTKFNLQASVEDIFPSARKVATSAKESKRAFKVVPIYMLPFIARLFTEETYAANNIIKVCVDMVLQIQEKMAGEKQRNPTICLYSDQLYSNTTRLVNILNSNLSLETHTNRRDISKMKETIVTMNNVQESSMDQVESSLKSMESRIAALESENHNLKGLLKRIFDEEEIEALSEPVLPPPREKRMRGTSSDDSEASLKNTDSTSDVESEYMDESPPEF